MSGAPARVVVVGHDVPLWLAASGLHAALGRAAGVTVEVVALPERATRFDVVDARPSIEALHARLRIDEARLLRATGGAFTLGRRLVDASGAVPPFFVGYGSHGAPIEGNAFLPYWLKARRHGLAAGLDDFGLTAAAALHGRMLVPDEETALLGRADYGYHLPAVDYARSLAALVRGDGLPVHEAASVAFERAADGGVAAVRLDGDRRVAGDLFVDACAPPPTTGGDVLTLAARGPRMRTLPAYAQTIAADWGWASVHPTAAATYVTAVFDAASEARVRAELPAMVGLPIAFAEAQGLAAPADGPAWQGNRVRIGPAAQRLDPLFGFDLHAVQLGLVHLLSRFPVAAAFAAERDDFCGTMAALIARLRDYQAAHRRLARYPGAFWQRSREAAVSPELSHRLATFAARGELDAREHETVAPEEWQALLIGHGLIPDSHAPAIDRTAPDAMRAAFRRTLGTIKDKVLAQPTHDAYLAALTGAAR
jgi:tryptophan 7-halogenase